MGRKKNNMDNLNDKLWTLPMSWPGNGKGNFINETEPVIKAEENNARRINYIKRKLIIHRKATYVGYVAIKMKQLIT